ncbi:nitrate reductase [Photobacterium sanctipauli]|uniref:Chaperone NapD n=1 Tax=Photobacterium sanctipauli TaxID=1342794 RepID=A0A2T3P021_9GAMM|nr:chaperone NapD [Photobacterium sanctipauli]PSW21873.1 nitrate reductase [Photobacterium sanctipauli]
MDEYHVCSLIVYAVANQSGQVKTAIENLKGAEVPIHSESGKMVVTLEGSSKDGLVDSFNDIKAMPGVLDTTLVFHQMDEQSELKEA